MSLAGKAAEIVPERAGGGALPWRLHCGAIATQTGHPDGPPRRATKMERTLWKRILQPAQWVLCLLALGACAALNGRDPVQVNVVGIEPLPGQGLEWRMAVKLRIQNPNETPVEFDGIALDLDVRGTGFASGVSDQRGSVPRFGETVLVVPVSVSATSMLRQVINFATGDRARVSYELRGKLAGAGFSSLRFSSSGEVDLPAGIGGPAAGASR